MRTDIQIAHSVRLKKIVDIAASLGLSPDDIELYGNYKCKISAKAKSGGKRGKLILVTAINPTPLGEGKTTTGIGLADGLRRINKKAVLALREPSLGPVFGIKGGATGGGMAQVAPMEDINLHFTGDMHAVTAANNLIASVIDNHIKQGNELNIDTTKIYWKRCLDVNDRSLRHVVCGLGGNKDGIPREESFTITAASEIMAIMCLAESLTDLKTRIGNVLIACSTDGEPIFARQLHIQDAAAILLKDALYPNLVQTLEGTPAIIHGGPFANIAHGCNSVIATGTALSLADYVVTEAGFGADLGAEKFFDIKCRQTGLQPDCVVIVATLRALKYNGGADKSTLDKTDFNSLESGICNLIAHIENVRNVFNMPAVVAVNRFDTDSAEELNYVKEQAAAHGAEAVLCDSWAQGGAGAEELARIVAHCADNNVNKLNFCYETSDSVITKIEKTAMRIYGAKSVTFTAVAYAEIEKIQRMGMGHLPICIAKTQYSFSADPKKLGAPKGHVLEVKTVELRSGAGFIVVIAGGITLMPGLSKTPASVNMTIDDNGDIAGLF